MLELELEGTSGFKVLAKLIPIARQPEVAVVVLTQLTHDNLLEAARMMGAQAALQKTQTTGAILDKTILDAISTVGRNRKMAMAASIPNRRLHLKRPA